MQDSDRWFWAVRDDAFGEGRAGGVVLHEIAGRLRVTDVSEVALMHSPSVADRNRLVARFRDEVALPLQEAGHVRLHEAGSAGTLADWIDDNAIEALARFASMTSPVTGLDRPEEEARWDGFLVAALPVRDGAGFADALAAVLVGNGWPEDAAYELGDRARRANSLLTRYRAVGG